MTEQAAPEAIVEPGQFEPGQFEPEPAREQPAHPSPFAVRGLALVVLVVAAVVGVLAFHVYDDRRAEAAASEGITALRSAVPTILAYDYRRLDADFAAAAGLLGGELKADFVRITEETIGPAARRDKTVIKANIAAVGLVSAEHDRVVALAFVDQVTTSDRHTEPKLDHNRVRFTIERSAGRWLVTSADML